MEKRRSNRVTDNLEAEIITDDICYNGIVLNFSEEGLYMVSATSYSVADINPSSHLKLKCKLPAGNSLKMDCEVKWFQTKPSPFGVTFCIGMQIIDPPSEYKDFVKTLR